MSALLGALGVVGLLVGIVLLVLGFVKKKRYKGGLIAIASLVMVIIAVSITPKEETASKDKPVAEETKADQSVTWEDKVKEVAANDGSESEKFDAISKYASDYKPAKDEISKFEDHIIKEYKDGNYIMDISNHEYMLENIFKSQVVEGHYNEGEPMKDFAFDFWQNSKYNYRGVDTMTSESTLANEKQMDKALDEMGR